jgi:hypothetical protein
VVKIFFLILILISLLYGLGEDNELLDETYNLPERVVTEEILETLAKFPLDLNKATFEDFSLIPYLTPTDINNIIDYRKTHNGFYSLKELKEVLNLNPQEFSKITRYLTINHPISPSGKFNSIIKLDSLGKNYSYLSSKLLFQNRIADIQLKTHIHVSRKIKAQRLWTITDLAFTLEKENYKLIFGNYELNWDGQLLFAGSNRYLTPSMNFTPHTFSFLTEALNIYSPTTTGIGYIRKFNPIEITGIILSNYYEAQVINGTVKELYFTRTENPSTNIKIRENLLGARASYLIGNRHKLNLNWYYTEFQLPWAPEDSINSFYGRSLSLMSLTYINHHKNYYALCELAHALKYGWGISNQFIADWRVFKINFSLYFQEKNFFSPHSRWRSLIARKDQTSWAANFSYKNQPLQLTFLARTRNLVVEETIPTEIRILIEHTNSKFRNTLGLRKVFENERSKSYGTKLTFGYSLTSSWETIMSFEDLYKTNSQDNGYLFMVGTSYNSRRFRLQLRTYYFNNTSSRITISSYEPIRNNFIFRAPGIRIFIGQLLKPKENFILKTALGANFSSLKINFDFFLAWNLIF